MGLLIIFSASAFLVLERALERIFEHRVQIHRRHILVSVVIPYLYMLVLGLGLIGLTTPISAARGSSRPKGKPMPPILQTVAFSTGQS